ncbi:MAG: hypothetical protein K6V73_12680 [Firmicutes bacterium]|nr:hypothetical protein [Bacillota bacterium]
MADSRGRRAGANGTQRSNASDGATKPATPSLRTFLRQGGWVGGLVLAAILVGAMAALAHTVGAPAASRQTDGPQQPGVATDAAGQGAEGAGALGSPFRLTSLTGQSLVFPGSRPTLLDFMSASCSSCWQGASQIARIWPRLKREAQVISLDVAPQVDSAAAVEQMAQATGARWPQAFATAAILNRYRVEYLDTAVVLSPTGRVLYDGAVPSNRRILALVKKAEVGAGELAAGSA